jgi:hypothetical protein
MKTWGTGCIDKIFVTSALVRGEWSVYPRFIPGERARRHSLDRRLGVPQRRSGRNGEVKILDPTGARTPNSLKRLPYLQQISAGNAVILTKVFIIFPTLPVGW